jgi:ABC-2 type transport system ATP-binding protein
MSSESPALLRIVGLTKRFGTRTVVDHLDLEVRAGEVLALLGPNGAGKTTTVAMILGLVRADEGRVEKQDLPPGRIGAIIESPAFYPFMSGRDNLRAFGLVLGGIADGEIDSLLTLLGLHESADARYQTYSLGMKQRLAIACTLLNDPALVILDEPTNGLDPAGQQEIRALIPRLAGEGRAILLASHLLHEVEQVADRVAILQRGRLLQTGSIKELLSRGSHIEISIASPEAAARVISGLPFVERVEGVDGVLRVFAPVDSGPALARALSEAALFPTAMTPVSSSLEEVFLGLTESGDAADG